MDKQNPVNFNFINWFSVFYLNFLNIVRIIPMIFLNWFERCCTLL